MIGEEETVVDADEDEMELAKRREHWLILIPELVLKPPSP